ELKSQFAELGPGQKIAIKRLLPDGKETTVAKRTDPPPETEPKTSEPKGPVSPNPLVVVTEPGPFLVNSLPSLTPKAVIGRAVQEFVAGRPEKAIEQPQPLNKPNQDFVLEVLPILERGATANLAADPAGTAVLVDQLRAVIRRIEPLAALQVENVTF